MSAPDNAVYRPKRLEWETRHGSTLLAVAKTGYGNYELYKSAHLGDFYYVFTGKGAGHGGGETPDAARAAAQSDYDERWRQGGERMEEMIVRCPLCERPGTNDCLACEGRGIVLGEFVGLVPAAPGKEGRP
ncbi:hypothetical protein [Alienimonas sp. DA493]|uniref:hypothetical protein n=1 Tax=Alienimonas sp. DA493 TaxID=3373605 RepID=UPI003753E8CA